MKVYTSNSVECLGYDYKIKIQVSNLIRVERSTDHLIVELEQKKIYYSGN